MPKRKYLDRPHLWSVAIPESVADEVDLRLLDPLRGRARYGARSQLITQLLRDWLSAQRGAQAPPETVDSGGPGGV